MFLPGSSNKGFSKMSTAFGPFSQLLGDSPELTFFSRPELQQGGGFSPRARRTFRQSFADVQNRFLGALGTQLRSDETPNLRFDDFLSGQGPQPFIFSNFQREQNPFGTSTGRFNPRTRQLFQF